ncbi:MAG: DNA mismatch endonuclease Vsr [Mesorhizobium sp.]|nr:MAG: DNA mismatch endonuclease Vsr [Mesorhizobium sp.]
MSTINPKRPTFEGVTEGRRRNMQANKSKDTKPELTIRHTLHRLGYRYRLHRRDLPGKPDLVFPSRRKIVEVRGCFWHGHGCSPLGRIPKARTDYWEPKIFGNRERDAKNLAALRLLGWDVLEVWECDIRCSPYEVTAALVEFLGPASCR